MKDKELKLNASGYKDEPCYQTIKTLDAPKPGEIYIHGDTGRYVLVLNCVNGVCAILNLTEQGRGDRIPVMARVQMYTNPIMITYAFTSALAQYVKTITDEECLEVKKAVTEALGLTCTILDVCENACVKPLEEKVKALEDELKVISTSHDNQEKLIKMLREERDAAVNVADQIHAENIDASIQLEKEKAKAQFYREMYDTLLDKLISARGCVNE